MLQFNITFKVAGKTISAVYQGVSAAVAVTALRCDAVATWGEEIEVISVSTGYRPTD